VPDKLYESLGLSMKRSFSETHERVILLSANDVATFIKMVNDPSKPNEALAQAMARHRKEVKDGTLVTTAGHAPSA